MKNKLKENKGNKDSKSEGTAEAKWLRQNFVKKKGIEVKTDSTSIKRYLYKEVKQIFTARH
jgi:hypothetical protein